jgi:hypothetical protein
MVRVLDQRIRDLGIYETADSPSDVMSQERSFECASTPEEIEKQLINDIFALSGSGVFTQKGHLRMIENKLRILYGTIGIEGTRVAFNHLFPPIDESNNEPFLLASEIAVMIHSQLETGSFEANGGRIIINTPGRKRVSIPAEIFLTVRSNRSWKKAGEPYEIETIQQILFGISYGIKAENIARYHAKERLSQAGKHTKLSKSTPEEMRAWIQMKGNIPWTEDVLEPFAEYFVRKTRECVDYQDIYMELKGEPLFQEHVPVAEEYLPGDPLPARAMYLIRNAIDHLRKGKYPNVPPAMKDINWNKLLFNEFNEEFTVGEDFVDNLVREHQQWCLGKDKDISGDTNEIVTGLVKKVVLTGHLPVELREPLIAALGNRYGIEPSPKSIRFQLCHFDKNVRIPPLMQALANLVGIEHGRIHSEKEAQIKHDWGQLIFADQLNREIYIDLRRYIEGEPNRKLPRNLHDTLVEICNDKGITPPSISAVRRYLLTQRQGYLARQRRILTEEV